MNDKLEKNIDNFGIKTLIILFYIQLLTDVVNKLKSAN